VPADFASSDDGTAIMSHPGCRTGRQKEGTDVERGCVTSLFQAVGYV
jgi:hypothetical protein